MPRVFEGSRGCHNCRRRKIKCDALKPSCTRCRVACLPCGGYRDDFRYVEHKNMSTGIDRCCGEVNVTRTSLASTRQLPTASNPRRWVVYLPRASLSLDTFKDDIYISYTIAKLFSGRTKILQVLSLPYSRVLSDDDVKKQALLALSMAYFARQHHLDDIKTLAMLRYGQSLRNFQSVISGSTDLTELPETVAILAIFELLTGSTGRQWVAHMIGLEKIFQTLGPFRLAQDTALLKLFEAVRPLMIGANIYVRKGSAFASQEWLTIPWCNHHKSLTQSLLDIWMRIPTVSNDAYTALDTKDHIAMMKVYSRAMCLHQELLVWFRHYQQFHICLDVAPTWQPKGWDKDPPWISVFRFDDTETAADYMSYWIACNLVLRAAQAARNVCSDGVPDHDFTETIRTNAINTCRVVEFMIQEPRRGAGIFHLMMPMAGAWQVLGYEMPEGKWLRLAMLEIHGDVANGWQSMDGILANLAAKGKWI